MVAAGVGRGRRAAKELREAVKEMGEGCNENGKAEVGGGAGDKMMR